MPEIDKRRLITTLQQKNPLLFPPKTVSSRSIPTHSAILTRIEKYSKRMSLELSVLMVPATDKTLINEKYAFVKEIKESTFSHTWVVT